MATMQRADESLAEQAEWAAWATAEAAAEAEAVKKAELASVMRNAIETYSSLLVNETVAFDAAWAEQEEWAEAAPAREAAAKLAGVMRHAVEACGPLPSSETAAFDAASVALDAAGRETGPDRKRALARLVLALTVLVSDQPCAVKALAGAAVTLAAGADCLDREIRELK